MIGDKAKLIEDVKAFKNKIYGIKGEVVTIASEDHGPVIIVENIIGERFSVKKEQVAYITF